MIHGKKTKRLGRDAEHRKALRRNLARELILKQEVKTTLARAKFVQPFVEKLVTRAGEDSLNNRRQVRRKLGQVSGKRELVNKLFEDLGPRFIDRPGGYTRVLKLDRRKGDGAPRAIIQFVE